MNVPKLSRVPADEKEGKRASGFFLPSLKGDDEPETLRGVPAPSVPPLLPPSVSAYGETQKQCQRLELALQSAEDDLRFAECALLEQEARTAECEMMIRKMQEELSAAERKLLERNRGAIALEEALDRDANGIRFAVDALLQVLEGRLPTDAV